MRRMAAVSATALALAGCGGSGDGLSVTVTAPPAGGAVADESYIIEWDAENVYWSDAYVNIYADTDNDPSTGLDLVSRQHLIDSLRHLAGQGITLVLVTHHIEEVIPEIQRVVLMKGGRIFADGTRGELLRAGPLSEVFGGPIEVQEEDGRLSAWARAI